MFNVLIKDDRKQNKAITPTRQFLHSMLIKMECNLNLNNIVK